MGEAGLLIRAEGAVVAGVDEEADALEPKRAEPEVADGAQRIGPVALVPFALLADGDPELCVPVREVDGVQAGGPDRPIVAEQADDEVVVGLALGGQHAVEPGRLGGLAHRREHREVAEHLRVVEPANEERNVGALGGAQVDVLPADASAGLRVRCSSVRV